MTQLSNRRPWPGRRRPRLGFLGVGWIGRNRLEAVAQCGEAEVVALCDASEEALHVARQTAPECRICHDYDQLLAIDLDGVVIATPSAMHAEQAIAALERGLDVFCQKPLGRSARETKAVVETARRFDKLLGVDLSYRHVTAFKKVAELVRSGGLGEIYAVDLVFHNAYGPDKPWFYDVRLSGGGAVIDLGIHLVDLGLWALGAPEVTGVTSRLYQEGRLLAPGAETVEDYATARIDLATGAALQLACSWHLPAGRDAVIGAAFYGTKGGAQVRNVGGSFYDFVAERFHGTRTETLAEPPDPWGGRAAVDWAGRLARGEGFGESTGRELCRVAEVLDRIYDRSF